MIARGARFIALFIALFALGVTSASARRIEIRILHTTDIHGHILPTTDYEGHTDVGGLLRCATLIRKMRAERENVLLIDCGDLYQGSAESLLTDGRIMMQAIDELDYDAWILGNHEFDWGMKRLVACHDACKVPMLAANIVALPGSPSPIPKLQPYLVRDIEGVRVIIVGLITPGVPSWSLPDLLGNLQFQHSVDALRDLMPSIRAAKPDILILAAHQGFKPHGDDDANEINAIAQNFPEFDAIIGGHSHRVVESEKVGDTIFTQAGYYGAWLGCLDLSFDSVTRKLIDKQARILPVADQYEPDAALEELFRDDLTKTRSKLDEVVGIAKDPLPAALDAGGRSAVQMLICRAIAKKADAEIVLHGVLADESLSAGDIRMRDIWRIAPYENRICVMLLTPQEIEDILLENQQMRDKIQFMGALGIAYDVTTDSIGQIQISNLRLPDGSFLHPRKRYRVAVNSYAFASGGGRFPRLREISLRPEVRSEVTSADTRSALVQYIRDNGALSADELLRESVK